MRKSGLPELHSPLPMPYKQAQLGHSPSPDHARLVPGSEVARKAGKAKLFDFQGFLSEPGGRQPGSQQLVTVGLTASDSRQLLKGTIGQKGGWWVTEHGPVEF